VRRLLALVIALSLVAAGCGGVAGDDRPNEAATLLLDFTPNAVHAGIYAALARGWYEDAGVDLTVREPGESSDAPKLLEAGRAEFAILDIHDLGIARERGLDVVAVAPIVQRPLASVIVRADGPVARPADLEGRRAGVTGLPSDEAVLESVVAGDGGDPSQVERVTIGFNAVASLAAGRVDAVTAFWNAEGVALRRARVPVRIFKVDRYGAPPYPELVLCTSADLLRDRKELVEAMTSATERGYRLVASRPQAGLEALLEANPELDRGEQAAQLRALGDALRPMADPPSHPFAGGFELGTVLRWFVWDIQHGILDGDRPRIVSDGFFKGFPQNP
jgi:putative hydroxymethylpyrimidine transport system substrate-binding protein